MNSFSNIESPWKGINRSEDEIMKELWEVPTEVLAAVCIQAIIAAVGVIANMTIIVVTTLGRGKKVQETSSIVYVTNLSISNVVFLVSVPFKLAEDINVGWMAGHHMCQIVNLIKFLNFMVVVLFLMIMAIDRYVAVNRALSQGNFRTRRTSIIISFVVWLASFSGALPLALFHSINIIGKCTPKFPDQRSINESHKSNEINAPNCRYPSTSTAFTVWTVCFFFYSFLIPFVIIVCSYSAIIRRVRQPTGSINSAGRLNLTVRRKVTRMAMFLVASYAVCYTPYHFWQVFRLIGIPVSSPSVCSHVQRFNHTMAYLNSAVHPFLYALASGQFSKQCSLAKMKILTKIYPSFGRRHPFSRQSNQTKPTIVLEMGNTSKVNVSSPQQFKERNPKNTGGQDESYCQDTTKECFLPQQTRSNEVEDK